MPLHEVLEAVNRLHVPRPQLRLRLGVHVHRLALDDADSRLQRQQADQRRDGQEEEGRYPPAFHGSGPYQESAGSAREAGAT